MSGKSKLSEIFKFILTSRLIQVNFVIKVSATGFPTGAAFVGIVPSTLVDATFKTCWESNCTQCFFVISTKKYQ